ncbi:MAG: 4Fe-4S dicluster domain-containing protein [Deltaproteobacteria bacterium]|nr:4Fe-4S dicluster domain-containing protein [Deltaproteobacteria bacterium]MBT4640168.1 4Fe-4S dicluster domain-containing protein [Deltaproteobacteria bacterium]MBT6499804.1 4Fe-4S dicluster domain-containing protein [Deltaproteobacteria bacterium]MBT6612252.1 4Fe-4S dicluster domain-containing protein [Deltaproteobacteria bacterium]MBT7151799.1 4Fe-4S dicluster domain-containing protein [Deltaproteobacteria bacterium]
MSKTQKTQGKKQIRELATGDRAILPEGARTIPVYIMGKCYQVPETLTIMKAMEFAGFKFLRGAGCRGGVCGACPTVFRMAGDYKLHFGLACQTVVEPDMYLAQIPFFPANRATYNIKDLESMSDSVYALYPELFRCVACNNCTKACPMDVDVLGYISAIKQGKISKAAEISFDCIQCGLCASRCMGEIPQYHLAQLVRRIYGRFVLPQAEHLKNRAEEIESTKYDKLLADLVSMDRKNLEKLYVEREREPDLAPPGTWKPKETKYL